MTGSKGKSIGECIIGTEFESTTFSPGATPRVSNDPVPVTVSIHMLSVVSAKAHNHHTMVYFIISMRAVKIALSYYSLSVALKHRSGVDANSNWLSKDMLPQTLIVHLVLLAHSQIFEMEISLLHFALALARSVRIVVFSQQDSIVSHILICLIHPAARANKVLRVTIN